MNNELFRFMTVRPPQKAKASAGPMTALRLDEVETPFLDEIRKHSSPAQRARLAEIVSDFVASPDFIDRREKLDSRVSDLYAAVLEVSPSEFGNRSLNAFRRIFNQEPHAFVEGPGFAAASKALASSIAAACLSTAVASHVRALLSEAAAVHMLILALAERQAPSKSDFEQGLIVLPADIFPLAPLRPDLASERALARKQGKREQERRARLAETAHEMENSRAAIAEVLAAIKRRSSIAPVPPHNGQPASGFILSEDELARLTKPTSAVLRRVGAGHDVDVSRAIEMIEADLERMGEALYRPVGTARLVRIGNSLVPAGVVEEMATNGTSDSRRPGPCPPAPMTAEGGDEPELTVPAGHGEARVIGIADLMLVEQKLARYELGEIAHVENVLKSERRERTFRTATTFEESELTEAETTEEKQEDLASTERYELQAESQNAIAESASKEAGLTINASYGPTVDATATLNYVSSDSRQQSQSASSNFARDITSRAMSRVQKRTLERRFWRRVQETEERNLHSFDNRKGEEDITGVYRYVEKVYTAQVVNYGKRLLLEVVVPEPAAFWRHALTAAPIDPVPYENPNPPGYCLGDGKTFVPLQAHDITRDNYASWASEYGARDVVPPPPQTRLATASRKGPESFQTIVMDGREVKISSDAFEVDLPDGYNALSAFANLYGETQVGDHKLVVQVQETQFFYTEPVDDGLRLWLRVDPSRKLSMSINSLRFHNYELVVTVLCTLSTERWQQWQMETFFAVMDAYRAAKSRYDNALEAQRVRSTYDRPVGPSAPAKREIEQTELKRGCISLISGQRFDTFDAMTGNVAPYGFPEIDFAEAAADARYVQLFEQAIEWGNMTYVFYPYFWGRKQTWPTLVQLADDDPLFTRFLQAGAARVQLPVRPGFEKTLLNYLAGAGVWDADGNLVTADGGRLDPLRLSVIDELKAQHGNNSHEGQGTLRVSNGSADVEGHQTAFGDEDVRRRITIGAATYVIEAVDPPERIRLDRPYEGESDLAAGYSLGGQLVGQPWEIRLPTNLVKLAEYAIQ